MMKKNWFLLVLFLISCAKSDEIEKPLGQILFVQDNRMPADSLYRFLRSRNDIVCAQALIALGQMQDTAGVDTLAFYMNHDNLDIKRHAIFALGQTGFASNSFTIKNKIEKLLLDQYLRENDVRSKIKIIEAVGKNGNSGSVNFLTSALTDTSSAIVNEAAKTYGIMAYGKFKNSQLDSAVVPLLLSHDPEIRWRAVYALMRSGNPIYAGQIKPLLKDDDFRVRMDAARALGAMGLDKASKSVRNEIVNALLEIGSNDPDWRVRVNALAALGNFKFPVDDLKKIYFLTAFEGKKDKDLHVRLTAIKSMAASYQNDVKDLRAFLTPFAEKHWPVMDWHEKAELINSLSQMFGSVLMDQPVFTDWLQACLIDSNRYLRARGVTALANIHSPKTLPFLEKALTDSFPLVQTNALDVLSTIKSERSHGLLLQALQSKNATAVAVAAGYLAEDESLKKNLDAKYELVEKIISGFKNSSTPDIESQIIIFDILGELKGSAAASYLNNYLDDSNNVVAQSAVKNFEKITGEKIENKKPLYHSVDYNAMLELKSKKPSAIIETSQGAIEIDLLMDDAPLTVMNFVRLAEKQFFDGVYFHRVVPNFVIQTGDPTGTGWGGPGYAIRSEFNQRKYERGIVGMASSGKDTEGSQWFITHSAQPHLDGRYTIFAKVTKGLEVVDKIQVGDRVNSVRIVKY
ncbi:HEAT repeat domain-containing protein [bacterium]|nr:HEAT repeat domain-containing protein [bacterium]